MMISFRLTGKDLEWLEEQQIDSDRNQNGELSLAVTAKRILLSNMTTAVDTPVDTPIDTQPDIQAIKEEIKEDILEAIKGLIQPIKDAVIEDREKIERIANTVNDIIEKTVSVNLTTAVDNPVDTPIDTKEKPLNDYTVIELRALAKSLEIPFKVRDNKAKLIGLISARKSSNPPSHHEP